MQSVPTPSDRGLDVRYVIVKYWRVPVAATIAFAFGWAEGKRIRSFANMLAEWVGDGIDAV